MISLSLFDFILSLLLVFNPGISEVDFNNVYSVLDDTSIHSIIVDDSAFDNLSQLANAGVFYDSRLWSVATYYGGALSKR